MAADLGAKVAVGQQKFRLIHRCLIAELRQYLATKIAHYRSHKLLWLAQIAYISIADAKITVDGCLLHKSIDIGRVICTFTSIASISRLKPQLLSIIIILFLQLTFCLGKVTLRLLKIYLYLLLNELQY